MEGVFDPEELLPSIKKISPVLLVEVLARAVQQQETLPELILPEYVKALCQASLDFKRQHDLFAPEVLRRLDREWKRGVQTGTETPNNLTSGSASGIVGPAMSKLPKSWPELRERLIALTNERGAKAALAREFAVTNSAVSEWLRGLSMPSADTTLRLLPWVAEAEAKQKSASSSRKTAGAQTTQSKKGSSSNETTTRPGRKKESGKRSKKTSQ